MRLASATIPNNELLGATIFLALFSIILVSLLVKAPKNDYLFKALGNSSYALYLLGGFTSIFLFTNLKDDLGIMISAITVYFFASIISILYLVFLDQKLQRILFLKMQIRKNAT
jgi:fucose 4-O-acetylase-like acetyltransferase